MEPYVDEGTHMIRASVVWTFETHPAQFSNGKFLLYFWLGLFDGPASTNLAAGRLSIALFSTLTAAAIYAIGRSLFDDAAGLLALAFYAILPLALFFERMALADPFAAGFAALLVWRSLIFARRPTLRQGALIGLLLTLATMAKLTMVLLPLVPVGATLLYHDWHGGLRGYVQRYLPGLIVAAAVVLLLWSPVLIPAYFAQQTSEPFVLVNSFNIQRADAFAPTDPPSYLRAVLPLIAELTAPAFLVTAGGALLVGLLVKRSELRSASVFLGLWLLATSVLVILLARVISVRYFVPAAAPLVLLLGLAWRRMWQLRSGLPRLALRSALVGAVGIWLLGFALPFASTKPLALAFSGNNAFDFQSGFLTADDTVREVADWLSRENAGIVYATREACHMLYFYSDSFDLRCLADDPIPDTGPTFRRELVPGESAYLVISWYYGPFHLGIPWLASEEIPLQTPPRFRNPGYEFRLWRIWIP